LTPPPPNLFKLNVPSKLGCELLLLSGLFVSSFLFSPEKLCEWSLLFFLESFFYPNLFFGFSPPPPFLSRRRSFLFGPCRLKPPPPVPPSLVHRAPFFKRVVFFPFFPQLSLCLIVTETLTRYFLMSEPPPPPVRSDFHFPLGSSAVSPLSPQGIFSCPYPFFSPKNDDLF